MKPTPALELIIAITGEEHNGIAESIATRENFYTASMKHPPPVRWRCYETGERGTIIRQRVGPDIYMSFLPDAVATTATQEINLPTVENQPRSPHGLAALPFDLSHILRN
mgnify:CR=1 FL=1